MGGKRTLARARSCSVGTGHWLERRTRCLLLEGHRLGNRSLAGVRVRPTDGIAIHWQSNRCRRSCGSRSQTDSSHRTRMPPSRSLNDAGCRRSVCRQRLSAVLRSSLALGPQELAHMSELFALEAAAPAPWKVWLAALEKRHQVRCRRSCRS